MSWLPRERNHIDTGNFYIAGKTYNISHNLKTGLRIYRIIFSLKERLQEENKLVTIPKKESITTTPFS